MSFQFESSRSAWEYHDRFCRKKNDPLLHTINGAVEGVMKFAVCPISCYQSDVGQFRRKVRGTAPNQTVEAGTDIGLIICRVLQATAEAMAAVLSRMSWSLRS